MKWHLKFVFGAVGLSAFGFLLWKSDHPTDGRPESAEKAFNSASNIALSANRNDLIFKQPAVPESESPPDSIPDSIQAPFQPGSESDRHFKQPAVPESESPPDLIPDSIQAPFQPGPENPRVDVNELQKSQSGITGQSVRNSPPSRAESGPGEVDLPGGWGKPVREISIPVPVGEMVPAVFQDDSSKPVAQMEALDRIAAEFERNVSEVPPGMPQAEAWAIAREIADERYITLFGYEAFNHYHLRGAREALREKKAKISNSPQASP